MGIKIEQLKKLALFEDLEAEELEEINSIVLDRKYDKGRIIFVEGEPGEAVYFLKSGRLRISKQSVDGREQILKYIEPGEVFAEVVLFGGGPYPATVEVVKDAEVSFIRNSDMENIIKENSSIAVKLLKVMSKRLRRAQMQVRDLALKDTFARMATILVKLSEENGIEISGSSHIKIDLELTNQDLANMIGTSRETANRILSDLRRQKIIEIDKQQITILNCQKLKEWI